MTPSLSTEHVTAAILKSHTVLTMYTLSNLQRCGFTQHIADGALWSYYNKGRRYYSKDLTGYTSGDDAATSVASETTDESQEYQ
jgi:hypothetical protein